MTSSGIQLCLLLSLSLGLIGSSWAPAHGTEAVTTEKLLEEMIDLPV